MKIFFKSRMANAKSIGWAMGRDPRVVGFLAWLIWHVI
jgi:hypothetical protein